MFQIVRTTAFALILGSVVLIFLALLAARGEISPVLASAPNAKPTVISGATAGPILTVENTGNKNTSAIFGTIVSAASSNGIVPTAVIGSATGTTGEEQGVLGITTSPNGPGVAGVGIQEGSYSRATSANGQGSFSTDSGAATTGVYGDDTFPAYVPPTPGATFPPNTETNGVFGVATDGNGVEGVTSYPYLNFAEPSGVVGIDTATGATANNGVLGLTTNGNAGVVGIGDGTGANNPDVGPSTGVLGEAPVGVGAFTSATAPPASSTAPPTGAVVAEVPYGAAATNTYYAYLALGTKFQTVFSVDEKGDVKYSGTLTAAKDVGNNTTSERAVAEVARPTLEDVGQSALRNGAAYVPIDPNFTASMEVRAPYMVFVTPGGEANQLYVTAKTPQGFWVRETRGFASIPFDYRIVAYPKGDTQRRITLRPNYPTPNAVYAARRQRAIASLRPDVHVQSPR